MLLKNKFQTLSAPNLSYLTRMEHKNEINVEIKPDFTSRIHNDSIESVSIHPKNSDLILTASHDSTIGIFDLSSENLISNFKASSNGVWCAQYNNIDGEKFVSTGHDGIVKIWDSKNNKILEKFNEHSSSAYWCEFDKTDAKVYSSGKNHEMICWDVNQGKMLNKFQLEGKIGYQVKISPDNNLIFTAEESGQIEVWDSLTNKIITKAKSPTDCIYQLDFNWSNPAKPIIYTASDDGIFRTYQLIGGEQKLLNQYDGHTDAIKSIKYIPSKKCIITGCRDSGIKVWDEKDYSFIAQQTKHNNQISMLAFHENAPDRLVSVSWDLQLNVYNLNNFNECKKEIQKKMYEIKEEHIAKVRENEMLKNSFEMGKKINEERKSLKKLNKGLGLYNRF